MVYAVEVSRKLKSSRKPPRDGRGKSSISGKKEGEKPKEEEQVPLPKSDAVLNCPACMVSLCLDCQRFATQLYNLTIHHFDMICILLSNSCNN